MQHNLLTIMIYRYFLRRDEELEIQIGRVKDLLKRQKQNQAYLYSDLGELLRQQHFLRELEKDIVNILKIYYK